MAGLGKGAPAYAGLREWYQARSTGTHVGLYDGEEAGMDTGGGRWQTMCEEHDYIMSHATLALARNWVCHPDEWCEDCMAAAKATTKGGTK